MSTCKDCLCFAMCLLSSEKAGICEEFKDRSKFIELPCKVGDKVYFLCRNQETYEWYICEKEIYSISVYENSIHFYVSPICSFVEMEIGVRLFLTKEEAEQALEEWNNGE